MAKRANKRQARNDMQEMNEGVVFNKEGQLTTAETGAGRTGAHACLKHAGVRVCRMLERM